MAPVAHPYEDVAVIDRRAPRTSQLVVGVVSIVALISGAWWLEALVVLGLLLALTLGRRWSLACRLWFDVLQPRLGEGALEDARPPRFAGLVSLVLALAATVLFAAGAPLAGWLVTAGLAGVALFSAISGVCLGGAAYRRIFGVADAREPQPGRPV